MGELIVIAIVVLTIAFRDQIGEVINALARRIGGTK